MVDKRLLSVFAVLILFNTIFVNNVTADQKINSKQINNSGNLCQSHLIENVSYVGQTTMYYCYLSSVTMVIKYNGYNSSLNEILFNSGMGYSLVYRHYFSPTRTPVGAMFFAGFDSYFCYLPQIYNLSYERYIGYDSYLTDNESWNLYWQRVKENVSENRPVITSVNPFLLPHLHKYVGNKTADGGHVVVIVGFNDTNNTLCINDPAPGYWNEPKNGSYIYVSQDDFKQAVKKTKGSKYMIDLIYKKDDFSFVSEEERFKKAHDKNIERMKGYSNAYNNYLGYNFRNPFLGVNALKQFKKDLRFGFTNRFLTIGFINLMNYSDLVEIYDILYCEKINASQYLLNKTYLSPVCLHDALLLEKEGNSWLNFTRNLLEIKNLTMNYDFFTALVKSFSLSIEMNKILSEMMSIQREIINFKASQ